MGRGFAGSLTRSLDAEEMRDLILSMGWKMNARFLLDVVRHLFGEGYKGFVSIGGLAGPTRAGED